MRGVKRYTFTLKEGSLLQALVEQCRDEAEWTDKRLSGVVREALCQYFGIDPKLAEAIYNPYRLKSSTNSASYIGPKRFAADLQHKWERECAERGREQASILFDNGLIKWDIA
jgi:hypothetical protein